MKWNLSLNIDLIKLVKREYFHLRALSVPVLKKKIWYVKGTPFRSPLHQHSVKNIRQVMKLYISEIQS